jgi:peptidoglycan/LPS O-acetylase OafA/YrhL
MMAPMRDVPVSSSRDTILDAWRGVSVLLVIQGHIIGARFSEQVAALIDQALRFGPPDYSTLGPDTKEMVGVLATHLSSLGVKFFFVISGYIITGLLVEGYRRQGASALRGFYIRRAFRIFPALLLYLGFVAAMVAQGNFAMSPGSFTLAFTFLCNTNLGVCSWPVGHLWSLGIEEQFYLVWPLLLAVLGFRLVPALAAVLMVVYLGAAQMYLLFAHGWLNNGMCFACLAAGALYATSPWLQRLIERCARPLPMIVAAVLLFGRPLFPIVSPLQYRIQEATTPLLICFVMFSAFHHRARLEAWSATRGLAKIGLISYGLYLWQQPFLMRPDMWLRPSILQYAPLFVAFALLSYVLVERPLLRFGATLAGRPPGGPVRDSQLAAD